MNIVDMRTLAATALVAAMVSYLTVTITGRSREDNARTIHVPAGSTVQVVSSSASPDAAAAAPRFSIHGGAFTDVKQCLECHEVTQKLATPKPAPSPSPSPLPPPPAVASPSPPVASPVAARSASVPAAIAPKQVAPKRVPDCQPPNAIDPFDSRPVCTR